MSLFPAYSAPSAVKDGEHHDQNDTSWLANGSFPATEVCNPPDERYQTSGLDLEGVVLSSISAASSSPSAERSGQTSGDKPSAPTSARHRKKHKRRRSRSRSSSPSRHKHQKRRHKKHKHGDDRPPVAEPAPLRGVFLEDAAVRPEVAFSVDRRADRAARAFPEMYHLHVARYGSTRGVLGRPGRDRRLADVSRYFDRRWRRRLRRAPADTAATSPLPPRQSYVPLATFRPRPPEPPTEPADYLRGLSAEFEFSRETAELNRRLAESPRDAALWLQLAEFQRRRLGGGVTAQQLLERQLAVLERALRQCPGSAALRLRRLELRQHQQPPEEAAREWSLLLFSHPADLGLWRRYLASQHHGSAFSLPALLAAWGRCLDKMRQFQADVLRPHRPPPALDEFMLELVGHLCRILRQSGYTERAIAIYQALLELNLFSPPADGSSGVPAALEPFWDSRLPRVGEPGARGWTAELAARSDRPPAAAAEPPDETEELLLAENGPRPLLWRRVEGRRAERQWLPWDRPGQEDDCEDTDRIVLFEDVRGCLFRVPPRLHARLVEDFVGFLCGDAMEDTPGDDTLRMLSADVTTLIPPSELPSLSEKSTPSTGPLSIPPLGPTIDCAEYASFIDRVLEQTSVAVPADQRPRLLRRRMQLLTRRAARLSSAPVTKETRRRLKAILKSERQSVPLFAEFAEFERTAGSPERAAHVLLTALDQSSADDPVRFELVHRCCLLRAAGADRAEAVAGCRAALCRLFRGEGPRSGAAPQLARAASRLRRLLPELTSLSGGGGVPQTAVPVTCCLAWCQLVSAGLTEAAHVISAVLADLGSSQTPETSSVVSSLHRAGCRLLAAARPLADPLSWQRHLQGALQRALRHLPLDPELTALAARHCPVPWRQRLSAAPDSAPPLLTLLRAASELSQLTAAAAARLRRRLARLVELPPLLHWPPLWTVCLELELRTGGKDLEAVCYRAVQACPWSKQIYLYLSGLQLRRAGDLMSRAGLRVRLPLEELDLLLEPEPEPELEPEPEPEQREARAVDGSARDSATGSESVSESESESEGGSGPGTPSPPPP